MLSSKNAHGITLAAALICRQIKYYYCCMVTGIKEMCTPPYPFQNQ